MIDLIFKINVNEDMIQKIENKYGIVLTYLTIIFKSLTVFSDIE